MNNLSFKKLLSTYLNQPFVIYKKPNAKIIQTIIQNNNTIHYTPTLSASGFVFSPFDTLENTILIKPDIVLQKEANQAQSTPKTHTTFKSTSKTAKTTYKQLVQKAIDQINSTKELKKIVVSRKEKVSLQNINLEATLHNFIKLYPNAFVYLWHHPKVGTWIGATPEKLIHLSSNSFHTMALAGTQLYENNKNTKWTNKNKIEQQLVTNLMTFQLKENFSPLQISEPYTIHSGHIAHLRTDISGKISTKQEIKTLIELLHPSAAVCGFPKLEAKTFILKNESYQRKYYTGFLGELHLNQQSHLFVNLRCMEINGNTGYLYVGGGITENSNPKEEWDESVVKSYSIKKALIFENQRFI